MTARALRSTAVRVQALRAEAEAEAEELEAEIVVLVEAMAPAAAADRVGPISAGQILVSWSHPGRFRSEAAFAAFAGTPPIPRPPA